MQKMIHVLYTRTSSSSFLHTLDMSHMDLEQMGQEYLNIDNRNINHLAYDHELARINRYLLTYGEAPSLGHKPNVLCDHMVEQWCSSSNQIKTATKQTLPLIRNAVQCWKKTICCYLKANCTIMMHRSFYTNMCILKGWSVAASCTTSNGRSSLK